MQWDSVLVRALAAELQHQLQGQRVRAIRFDAATRRVHLFLKEATLVAEMHPADGWVLLLDPTEPDSDAIPLPARVRSVEALPDERILRFSLERIRGRDEGVWLVLSWVGTRWNALLVGYRSGKIHQVLLPRHGGDETLVTGLGWTPPSRTPRAGAPGGALMDPDTFTSLQAQGRSALLTQLAWSSTRNVDALMGPSGWSLWTSFAHASPHSGTAWIHPGHGGRDAFLYPIALPESPQPPEEIPSLIHGMAILRARAQIAPSPATERPRPDPSALLLPPSLLERMARYEERLRKQRASLSRELRDAPEPEHLRGLGDLLLAYFRQVPKGASSAQLTGFDGGQVEIPLDPALGVQENAARFYAQAARAQRARTDLPDRIAQVDATQTQIAQLLTRVLAGDLVPEALATFLDDAGVREHAAGGSPRGRGTQHPAPLPYHRFRSSTGREIRVGRGARHNDELTFRHARPGEIWLHVREAPGAHVVLRWEGDGSPPPGDLEEAAILAALHSDARHAGLVPVDWTRRKHVRKPRKAPPGAVIPAQVRTLFVAPNPELIKRLRW